MSFVINNNILPNELIIKKDNNIINNDFIKKINFTGNVDISLNAEDNTEININITGSSASETDIFLRVPDGYTDAEIRSLMESILEDGEIVEGITTL